MDRREGVDGGRAFLGSQWAGCGKAGLGGRWIQDTTIRLDPRPVAQAVQNV